MEAKPADIETMTHPIDPIAEKAFWEASIDEEIAGNIWKAFHKQSRAKEDIYLLTAFGMNGAVTPKMLERVCSIAGHEQGVVSFETMAKVANDCLVTMGNIVGPTILSELNKFKLKSLYWKRRATQISMEAKAAQMDQKLKDVHLEYLGIAKEAGIDIEKSFHVDWNTGVVEYQMEPKDPKDQKGK